MVTCANGHPCRDDLRFCGECGIPISPHTALCAYGHINPEENTFCGDCGAPVAPPVLTRSKQTHGRWMVDPTSRHQFRYLAGSRWTHHVADIGEGSLSVDPVPRAWRSQAASRAGLVAAVVLALLVAAVAIAGATFSRLGQAAQPSPEGQPAVAVPTAVPPAEYLPTPTTARPFAIIGAPCSPTSVNGVQRDGTPAYCEPLEGTTTYLWSMYWGPIESPYPPGTPAADREDPSIAVCMAQRDLTRQACIAELP